ncbi:hypothetical protein ACFC3F_00950 [Microbacterium sp. NPDC055910]|uniref:IS1096 element passenger TnpR family protein n=1 Tax=Microbacterium sp. NPDC055910 TaxID=3345659 RepID=UPI0035DAE8A3
MRSSAVRHVTHLRLTLVGPVPEIRRDVAVDRSLSLADLHRIVLAVFDRPQCRHHLFTDTLDRRSWSRGRRRWGDRWTMIDLRDPNVIDEATARIGSVLHESHTIYHGHTCPSGWLIEIEAGVDDIVPSSDPPARVLDGARRAPLPCCRRPYEHDVLVGVLADTDHPDHDAMRACLASTVGPWARFDPEEFDLGAVQRALDGLFTGAGGRGPLTRLVDRFPAATRPGLRAHLAAAGLELPAVVTADEADDTVRDFRWLIECAGAAGIPLIDGAPDPSVIAKGIRELGGDEARMLQLVAWARRLRLLYLRGGRLIAKKSVLAAARSSFDLWMLLAEATMSGAVSRSSSTAQALFLLAIADGSLIDPEIGVEHAAQALQPMQTRFPPPWDMYEYSDRDDDCDSRCDCSDALGATWHALVTKAIRDAATAESRDGASTVASALEPDAMHELGVPREWVAGDISAAASVATRIRGKAETDSRKDAFMSEVGDVTDLLSLFGLARTDDGGWLVPSTLREFARAALQSRYGTGRSQPF